jgi:hypothetical protein
MAERIATLNEKSYRNSGALPLEAELLLAAARGTTDVEMSEELAAALSSDRINWKELLAAANDHTVSPLLWSYLSAIRSGTVPPKILQSLQRSFQLNTSRNVQLTGELWKIIKMFAAHDIVAIPFKGPTLSVLAYGDLAWRQFSDLDVLIDRADLARAGELLEKHGYQPEVDLRFLREESFLLACTALSFRRPEVACLVELHWELSPGLLPFELSFAEIRERAVTICPGGKPMLTLSPEDLLLYLCSHGARHYWSRLGWIADVAWLIERNPQLEWARVLETARRLRSERILFLGLLLASGLLGANLPPDVESRIRADGAANALATQIASWLLLSHSTEIGITARDLFYLRFQDGWREKLRYLFRLVTSPNMADWQFLPLPGSLTFLYPLIRIFRLIKTQIG